MTNIIKDLINIKKNINCYFYHFESILINYKMRI